MTMYGKQLQLGQITEATWINSSGASAVRLMENRSKAGIDSNTTPYSSYSKKHKDYMRRKRRRENVDKERTVTALSSLLFKRPVSRESFQLSASEIYNSLHLRVADIDRNTIVCTASAKKMNQGGGIIFVTAAETRGVHLGRHWTQFCNKKQLLYNMLNDRYSAKLTIILPAALYGSLIWSLILKWAHKPRCLRTDYWGEYLDLRGGKQQKRGENYITNSFVICAKICY